VEEYKGPKYWVEVYQALKSTQFVQSTMITWCTWEENNIVS
jgi:hypothetical protein